MTRELEQKNSNRIITQIILGTSIRSVRLVVALFVLCSAITKVIFDTYLPDIIDFDIVRWTIISLGALFYISTFFRHKLSAALPYISFFLYLSTFIYVVAFVLVNHFHPGTVTILILIIGASTIIINNLTYYGIQSGIIVLASSIVFLSNTLSNENTVAFYNLLVSIGVFAIVVAVRLKLISSVRHSHSNLEKLQVLSIIADKNGDIVFVSPSVRALLGYEPRDLKEDGWWRSYTLSKGWIAREHILNYPNIIPKELVSMECKVTSKDGRTVWLNWVNSVLPNGNYMGIALDITKYKEVKKESTS